ncbi:MAG TPA: hypothetical protein VFR47_28355 [Anaerolineales bacterium]|nr:hypothetical protein [Anaerolineales bacterium]
MDSKKSDSANAIMQKLSGGTGTIISAIAWVLIYLLARWLLDNQPLEEGVRIVVALLPIVPFALFLGLMLAGIRQMDELHRRVHLEALAIAYPLAMLLFMLLGLLELVIPLSPEDWSYRHVWQFLPLLYFLGLAFTWRRYQ